jgi:hypothetical protein
MEIINLTDAIHPLPKERDVLAKIYKIAKENKDIDMDNIDKKLPSGEALSLIIQTLKEYLRDNKNNSKVPEEWKDLISRLPSPRQVKMDFSHQECKVLYETLEYLWKNITKEKIIPDEEVIPAPEKLMGNYWMISNGILLEGINSYDILKRNSNIICSLLGLSMMTLQEYLCNKPNTLIKYILRNGGVRLFITKDGRLYAQMSSEVYGKWGKAKIKKLDFKKKVIKVVDLKVEYNGWKSGISIVM